MSQQTATPSQPTPSPKMDHPKTTAGTEQIVLNAIRISERGLRLCELAERLQKPRKLIATTLQALCLRGALLSVGTKGAIRYQLPNQASAQGTAPRTITGTSRGPDYEGTELERDPGLPPERFAANELPSRIGDRRYYLDGRVEVVS